MTLNLDDSNFAEEVIHARQPVLVDFYADWCPPCRQMLPVVEELSRELSGQAKIVKVNVDRAPGIAQYFGVQSIPTFAVIDNNEVVDLLVGAQPKASLMAAVQPYLKR